MCFFLSCFVWVLTLIQRFVTMVLIGLICFIVCVGVFTAVAAGVAYGYNYSKSEYLTIKSDQNPPLILHRTAFHQGKDSTNDWSVPALQRTDWSDPLLQGADWSVPALQTAPRHTFGWNNEQLLSSQFENSPIRITGREADMAKKNSPLQQFILNDAKSTAWPKRYQGLIKELRRTKINEDFTRQEKLVMEPTREPSLNNKSPTFREVYDSIKVKTNKSPSNGKQLPYVPYLDPINANLKRQLSSLQPTINLISQRRTSGKSLNTASTTQQPTTSENDDEEDEYHYEDEKLNFTPV